MPPERSLVNPTAVRPDVEHSPGNVPSLRSGLNDCVSPYEAPTHCILVDTGRPTSPGSSRAPLGSSIIAV